MGPYRRRKRKEAPLDVRLNRPTLAHEPLSASVPVPEREKAANPCEG